MIVLNQEQLNKVADECAKELNKYSHDKVAVFINASGYYYNDFSKYFKTGNIIDVKLDDCTARFEVDSSNVLFLGYLTLNLFFIFDESTICTISGIRFAEFLKRLGKKCYALTFDNIFLYKNCDYMFSNIEVEYLLKLPAICIDALDVKLEEISINHFLENSKINMLNQGDIGYYEYDLELMAHEDLFKNMYIHEFDLTCLTGLFKYSDILTDEVKKIHASIFINPKPLFFYSGLQKAIKKIAPIYETLICQNQDAAIKLIDIKDYDDFYYIKEGVEEFVNNLAVSIKCSIEEVANNGVKIEKLHESYIQLLLRKSDLNKIHSKSKPLEQSYKEIITRRMFSEDFSLGERDNLEDKLALVSCNKFDELQGLIAKVLPTSCCCNFNMKWCDYNLRVFVFLLCSSGKINYIIICEVRKCI